MVRSGYQVLILMLCVRKVLMHEKAGELLIPCFLFFFFTLWVCFMVGVVVSKAF